MHPGLFSADDRVLLVGEGNFSFAVALASLNLPIIITASSPSSQIDLKLAKENIALLQSKGVRVILDVNATQLVDHPVLSKEKFSKIIFNFPHVGGKMKIHLNRLLVEQFFYSCVNLLASGGEVWVSLCKGQGGTRAEVEPRRWDDTWQVVELAARSDLVLTAVEPFCRESLPTYTSVGYRGRDAAFNINGALLHVFCKRAPIFHKKDINILAQRLQTKCGLLNCCYFHKTKYKNNPFLKEGNPVRVLYDHLRHSLAAQRAIREDDVALFSKDGMLDVTRDLRCAEEAILFPGVVFNKLGTDFNAAPATCQVSVLGLQLVPLMSHYINHMLQVFAKDTNLKLRLDPVSSESSKSELLYQLQANNSVDKVKIASQRKLRSQTVVLLHIDKLAELLFDLSNWRQLWADEVGVSGARLKGLCYDSVTHVFDICFTITPAFTEEKLCDILWQLAGDIIIDVSLLNEFASPEGWKTRCYRIKYKAFDKPLCRKEAVDIHENVIGKILCRVLNVTTH